MILFMFSRCLIVIRFSRFKVQRAMTSSVITHAKPEKIAPATKYGGKMVVCQPGITEVAKSNETMVCTDSTNGVLKPANTNDKLSCRCQCLVLPDQPNEATP